jgi:hypothetical protein
MKLFVEAYLRVMLGGTVDVLIERSLKNGVLALVLHTAVPIGLRHCTLFLARCLSSWLSPAISQRIRPTHCPL